MLSSKPRKSCPKEAWKMYGLCQRVSSGADGWLCNAAVLPGWKDHPWLQKHSLLCLVKAFLKTQINICTLMLLGQHAPPLIRCNSFHGALIPAIGIPTVGADTRLHQACLVLPLHYWLNPQCSQDTALKNPSGHTTKGFGEVQ